MSFQNTSKSISIFFSSHVFIMSFGKNHCYGLPGVDRRGGGAKAHWPHQFACTLRILLFLHEGNFSWHVVHSNNLQNVFKVWDYDKGTRMDDTNKLDGLWLPIPNPQNNSQRPLRCQHFFVCESSISYFYINQNWLGWLYRPFPSPSEKKKKNVMLPNSLSTLGSTASQPPIMVTSWVVSAVLWVAQW